MKTLKAMFWGSLAGFALGRLFAPRSGDVLRAEKAEQQGGAGSTATARRSASGQGGMAVGSGMARGQQGQARCIGNTHTKVYHDIADGNLPSEENRIYFGSAKEAEAQGYHHAGNVSAPA